LVDGKLGTTDFRDGNWQGFWGNDAELLLDLGKEQYAEEISINCYQYNNAWIFFPSKVEFSFSLDGKNYVDAPSVENKNIDPKERGKFIDTYTAHFEKQQIRYVKIKTTNLKKVPIWHEAAGSDAWIFMDEIIVR